MIKICVDMRVANVGKLMRDANVLQNIYCKHFSIN